MNFQGYKTNLSIFSFLLFFSFCLSSVSLSSEIDISLTPAEKQWLVDHKTIRVSGPQTFPPFQFFDKEERYVGIASDYLELIADNLDISLKYQKKTPWIRVLEMIRLKEIDILTCTAFTEERSQYMLFSEPHISFPLVIVSRKDLKNINKIEDIKGKRLAIKKQISTEYALKRRNIDYTPYYIDSPRDALKAVSLGKADVAIENLAAASYIIDQKGYANLKIAGSTGFTEYALSIGIRDDWPIFLSIINKSLSAISDEQHRQIRQRWFSVRYEHGITSTDVLTWGGVSLLFLATLFSIFLLWNRRLVREIDERKAVEIKLRESERKLSTLIENLPGIAYRCRNVNEWPMEFMSEGCVDVTGYLPSEISKDSPLQYGDIIHPDDKQFVWDIVQASIEGKHRFELEYRIIDKAGNTKWVWERGSIVSDLQTKDIYLEGFIADITQQKLLAEKLHQSQKMEAIGALAGGIAHDFNNILASIIGFTELALSESELGSDQEKDLHEVLAASIRARDLVKQILAFARKSEVKVEHIKISTIIHEVLKFIRSTLPTSIEINHTIESDSSIRGSSTQVYQILMNLCTNAAQAMEGGGVLELQVQDTIIDESKADIDIHLKHGKYVEIRIIDSGHGISPEIIDKIFDPYFTTKEAGEGTGMGLAMVHGIVKAYGGTITVKSTPQQGSTFTLLFPASTKEENQRTETNEELPTGSEHILLIDDEISIGTIGKRILGRLGYTVTTLSNPVEALLEFEKQPQLYDLIITDFTMPTISGDQLTTKILNIRPDIPIILCTGYSKKLTEKEAAELGVKAYIHKPLTQTDLSRIVRETLDNQRT